MQQPFFSIIVVSLNPGDRLKKTLDSIGKQTYDNYEVILKDGGSKDGSIESLYSYGNMEENKIRIIQKEDRGIYDAMNQALSYVNGRYVQFLNCGDYFYSENVLKQVAEYILSGKNGESKGKRADISAKENKKKFSAIYYGNQYNEIQKTIVYSAPRINDFTCYRNVPCHQVCFYDAVLFKKRAYEVKYKVRADYEHFLYSIYEEGAKGISMPVIVASYEGGGFSETKENRKKSAIEHREITEKYLGKRKVLKYRAVMCVTLAPLRTWIAESPVLSEGYNRIKRVVYNILKKN